MKRTKHFVLFYAVLFSFFSCHKDADVVMKGTSGCDTSNTNFNQLYNNLIASNNYEDIIFMDAETHAYSFEVTTPKTICKIGYQSLPYFNSTPYLIEIYDSTTNTLEYSGYHTFSSNHTSYVSITPVNLMIGHLYSISRIQKNWAGNIGNTCGRLLHTKSLPNSGSSGNISFPIIFGDLKIMGSKFYGTGGPNINWALPYIDIVFE